MDDNSYLKYLLSDNLSLRKYYKQRKPVNLQDVERSVLLQVRLQRYEVPDHYYRLGTEYTFRNIKTLSHLFVVGLPQLVDEYLEFHNDRVYVKGNKFNEWQLLLPYIPPLILVTAKIWKYYGPVLKPETDFCHRYLLPSIRYTAIPPAYLPEMETLKRECDGFHDLHIHLNGTIEADLTWQDITKHPVPVYKAIMQACKNDNVREQFEQLTEISEAIAFLHLFRIAGNIRQWLFEVLEYRRNIYDGYSFEQVLDILANKSEYDKEHPYKTILGEDASPLILESLFYMRIFDYLSANPNDDSIAGAFHYYLLILGLCNRLLVQQQSAFGFDQFQKYTLNNIRDFSEQTTYNQRFSQLAGNDLMNINHIEGRFSPKNDINGNISIIDKIATGFSALELRQTHAGVHPSTLSLIAHFIKKKDSPDAIVRFHNLRTELNQKTAALIALLNTKGRHARMIKGVDAAANELYTPPYVFAASFGRLRQCGVQHFTFHAGEDYFHILTGLRSIYEAIDFLDMQPGDRIGHATAAGVDVDLWRANIGEKMLMRREEYMDDLVFAYYLITECKEKSLEHLLPNISLKVEKYASEIYPSSYGISDLIAAWKMRKTDPFADDKSGNQTPRAAEIYQYYLSQEVRMKGQEIISIDTYDIFSGPDIIRLQQLLLENMHQKQIVIETLPTSNVIIGQHHGFETYHLYNWYKWSKEGLKMPAIVVGCDDAGIFATNIYNEYCHIYCMLTFDKGISHHEAITYIERLVHNAKVYAF